MPVTLHVWRVPRRRIGAAFLRMARDPRRLRALPGVRFAKLLGTGTGDTFGPGDADLTRYAALVVRDGATGDIGEIGDGWDRIAESSARVDLTPVHSHGTWSGQTPFVPSGEKPDGMVLAVTRFAYHQPQHRAVIARTQAGGWYAEDLFARFAVRDIIGDRSVLGWRQGGQAQQ